MFDTSYAVLTRAKAKFGKRLTEKDYKSLLDCENVAEVMAYLKSNTKYISAFGEANERGIRRGLFENLLRQYMTNEIDTLSRFELSVGEEFSQYLAHKQEVEEIIRFLTLLSTTENTRETPFNFTVPRHMAKKTSIKLNTLFEAKSYSQFLEALKGTRYESFFRKYHINDGDLIPIAEIENGLYIELYKELYAIPEKMKSSERDELRDILNTIIDYENFTRIIRFKKYYDADFETVLKYLLPFGGISRKTLEAMIDSSELGEVFDLMKKTKSGKLLSKTNYSHTGELPVRVKFRKARHSMYYSDSPATVMFAYILLCEVELHNLIIIIEAARYNVDREKIEPILIY